MPRKSKSKKNDSLATGANEQPQDGFKQPKNPKHNQSDSDSDDSSSDEEEDDFGDLITDDVEQGINDVLSAIKNNDPKLFNPEIRFFNDSGKITNEALSKSNKPLYLKDYQRSRLLNGELNADADEEEAEKASEPVKTYAQEQEEDRQGILAEINKAFGSDEEKKSDSENSNDESDDNDDGFLKKKAKKTSLKKVEDYLPDPEKEGEDNFLNEFMQKQAWIPKKKTETGDIILDIEGETIENVAADNDDEQFDEAVEEFENAYNFRYEDPTSAEIVSYARNQATLRRSETSSRRTKRDKLKQEKEKEKDEKNKALNKKKKEKVNKIQDIIKNLEKEYGQEIQSNPKVVEKLSNILINDDNDYDEAQWDQVISEVFAEQDGESMEKPTWDDDDDIMAEFNASKRQNEEAAEEEAETTSNKKSKRKAKLEAKREGKKQKKELQTVIETVVDDNKLVLMDEVEEERKSRSKTRDSNPELKFKYREVSPESFGLSYREIFAADDESLNKYINIKKFAPYREKNLRDKDKRKVTKSKRIAEWRKEVFNDKNGPSMDFEGKF